MKKQQPEKTAVSGACDPARTDDLRITNALHYRLCYTSNLNDLYIINDSISFFNTFIYFY